MDTVNTSNRHERAIGILAACNKESPPLHEERFLRRLCLIGQQKGITVYVFSPLWIDWNRLSVQGYVYSENAGWQATHFTVPKLIYDRFYSSKTMNMKAYQRHLHKLKQELNCRVINPHLGGKWKVYTSLRRWPIFHNHLPKTRPLRKSIELISWLKQYEEAVIKPITGSQGRGVIHIQRCLSKTSDLYSIRGRDHANHPISHRFESTFELLKWLHTFLGNKRYLIQPYLFLSSTENEPFDIRVLMQKNGKGFWSLTGTAVRLGMYEGLTSNLHGGGKAYEAISFLKKQFGAERSVKIHQQIEQLAREIPSKLELMYGRLAELGIDFGVDRNGHIWILEINTKPGRSSFIILRQTKNVIASIENPIHYANYLLDQHLGGHLK